MSIYTRGYRLEREVRNILKKEGYTVIRSAGSKGLWDLVAYNAQEFRLIQIKKGRVPVREREIIKAEKTPSNTSKEIWVAKDSKWAIEVF